jgi:hypothetical protein
MPHSLIMAAVSRYNVALTDSGADCVKIACVLLIGMLAAVLEIGAAGAATVVVALEFALATPGRVAGVGLPFCILISP